MYPIAAVFLRTFSLSSRQLRNLRFLTTAQSSQPESESGDPPLTRPFPPNFKSRSPLEKQFESWIETLKPGFTPYDVTQVLRAQTDPDSAMDIFRWTAQRRGYKHDPTTYLTMIQIAVAAKRTGYAEILLEEVLAGACPVSLPLYNSIIRFCCSRRFLFRRAFDVYKKMLNSDSEDAKPDLDTYSMLFNVLLRRFNKIHVSYVYLHAVRSLSNQMKALGVIPDAFVLNLIIKAYSKCLELDQAIRVFREMGLYGCHPNAYSYSYIIKGLCEKGRLSQGLRFYKEMRDKGFLPTSSTFMILICSLAMDKRFQDAIEAVFDMLENRMSPDFLTYKTLFAELCREGRGTDAFQLLEELREKDAGMGERAYNGLLDELHFLSKEY